MEKVLPEIEKIVIPDKESGNMLNLLNLNAPQKGGKIMIKNISAVLIVLASLIVLSTVFIVDETEQVVILQFGNP